MGLYASHKLGEFSSVGSSLVANINAIISCPEHNFYECRGDICYDDEHDEVPEEGLWNAACKLEQRLKNQGIDAEVEHSEKGWVEVCIII